LKRAKYKAKNIHAFKRIWECDHPECKDHGIITYAEESPTDEDGLPVTRRRCIQHVHWTKEPPQVRAAKEGNRYVTMTLPKAIMLLDPMNYNAGMGKEVIRHGS
jgi:hypothetical protein